MNIHYHQDLCPGAQAHKPGGSCTKPPFTPANEFDCSPVVGTTYQCSHYP
jgi:hypothetical protein